MIENLKPDAASFVFESINSEVGNWKIAAQKRHLSFAAESFDMTVVVAYMNFGSDSAIEVVDNLVEVIRTLDHSRGSNL